MFDFMVRHFPGGAPSSTVTKQRILDVAERLCAERGIEAFSVRTVCEEAGANVAAINYHFGNKQNLLEEMFRRRVAPLNEERLRLLDAALLSKSDDLLERVIRSFLGPVIRGIATSPAMDNDSLQNDNNSGWVVAQFLSRVHAMHNENDILTSHYEPVRSRFILAFQHCLPNLTLDELLWRYNMMVGALIYAMKGPLWMVRRPIIFSNNHPDNSVCEPDYCIEQMVPFVLAGFSASTVPKHLSDD